MKGKGEQGFTLIELLIVVANSEAFISADLGLSDTPAKSGYDFTMGISTLPGAGPGPTNCLTTATVSAYYATAIPQTHGTTGTRSFAVNAGNTIWQNVTAAAPTEPFAAPNVPVQ